MSGSDVPYFFPGSASASRLPPTSAYVRKSALARPFRQKILEPLDFLAIFRLLWHNLWHG